MRLQFKRVSTWPLPIVCKPAAQLRSRHEHRPALLHGSVTCASHKQTHLVFNTAHTKHTPAAGSLRPQTPARGMTCPASHQAMAQPPARLIEWLVFQGGRVTASRHVAVQQYNWYNYVT